MYSTYEYFSAHLTYTYNLLWSIVRAVDIRRHVPLLQQGGAGKEDTRGAQTIRVQKLEV